AFRVGHGREVAVVGGADPARARRVGAELAHAAAAFKRLRGPFDQALAKAVAVGGKAVLADTRTARRARPPPGPGERGRRRIDERHALLVAADHTGLAGGECFQARQESRLDELRRAPYELAVERERRMDVEPVAAARTGRAARLQRRVAVRDIDDAGQIAA